MYEAIEIELLKKKMEQEDFICKNGHKIFNFIGKILRKIPLFP